MNRVLNLVEGTINIVESRKQMKDLEEGGENDSPVPYALVSDVVPPEAVAEVGGELRVWSKEDNVSDGEDHEDAAATDAGYDEDVGAVP